MTDEEIIQIIEEINELAFDSVSQEYIYMFCLEYITNGPAGLIEFMGETIWNNQDDMREWDDDKDDYEPLRDFLLRGMRNFLFQAQLLETKLQEQQEGIDSTQA